MKKVRYGGCFSVNTINIINQSYFKGILLGKPEDIIQVTKGEWKETLAAYLIYNYPAATYTDINDVLSELNDYIVTPTPENSDLLNQVLFSFVINELNQAIRICARLDWWLVKMIFYFLYLF